MRIYTSPWLYAKGREIDILATLEENYEKCPPPLTNSWIRAWDLVLHIDENEEQTLKWSRSITMWKKLSINLTTLNSWETINEENYFAGHGIKVFWVFGAISDVCYVFWDLALYYYIIDTLRNRSGRIQTMPLLRKCWTHRRYFVNLPSYCKEFYSNYVKFINQ